MTNAKEELLNNKYFTTDKAVDYCFIQLEQYNADIKDDVIRTICSGPLNLDTLDFTYDNGYGGQELFGYIVFTDGTWLERAEYDGSEWWTYKQIPPRP